VSVPDLEVPLVGDFYNKGTFTLMSLFSENYMKAFLIIFSTFAIDVYSSNSALCESELKILPFTLNNENTSNEILSNPSDLNSSGNVFRF
jgi:hypothetical protein